MESSSEKNVTPTDIYRKSRFFYIIEAAVEYFISMLVSGTYLARVTTAIGMSDSLTAILSAFVSLGCGAQMLAILFVNRPSVKGIVTVGHTVNQLLFSLVYILPILPVPAAWRAPLLAIGLLLGHLISNIIHAPKINWFMSLVDDHKRGRFTANKEIVSLLGGMIFTFGMGKMIDAFEAKGNLQGAFIVSAVALLVLTAVHTITLVLSKEKVTSTVSQQTKEKDTRIRLRDMLSNKALLTVLPVSVLWAIINYATTPFYGTYQNKELAFSATFIAVIAAVGSLSRALFSRSLGRLADKRSFATVLTLCFGIIAVAFAVNIFTVPQNGKILFPIYLVLHSIAMAGINSGDLNLVYDYIPPRMRTVALALKCSIAGVVGFLTTLLISRLVAHIQENGNTLFGISVYAQQVVSAIGLLVTLLTVLYLRIAVKRLHLVSADDSSEA